MKASMECLPCLGKNAVDVACRITSDDTARRKIISQSLHLLADCDCSMPPPFYAAAIHRIAKETTGQAGADPYLEEKRRSTRLAEELLKELKKNSCYNPNDFESRLRLAVAGNILDFGIYADLDIQSALQTVLQAFTKDIDLKAMRTLKERMESAKHILYILDNCGEAVFDREFIAPYRSKTTIGVRGFPVFNDVTKSDLADSGLEAFAATIVENASDIPGTIIELAGDQFRREFVDADLVIAKGQGNFETLSDTPHSAIAFLFMAKCPVVCKLLHAEQNSLQLQFYTSLS
ncbi:MAG: DUF89 family protein [Victivallales bacterium]|nr:DUF89 family protein [Victivallales bacterium]